MYLIPFPPGIQEIRETAIFGRCLAWAGQDWLLALAAGPGNEDVLLEFEILDLQSHKPSARFAG